MRLTRGAWNRMGDIAKAVGDAVATPRGAAPDRADGGQFGGGER